MYGCRAGFESEVKLTDRLDTGQVERAYQLPQRTPSSQSDAAHCHPQEDPESLPQRARWRFRPGHAAGLGQCSNPLPLYDIPFSAGQGSCRDHSKIPSEKARSFWRCFQAMVADQSGHCLRVGIDSCLRDHRDHRGASPFPSESNPGEATAVSSMAK